VAPPSQVGLVLSDRYANNFSRIVHWHVCEGFF
jgi:hypothetical protein